MVKGFLKSTLWFQSILMTFNIAPNYLNNLFAVTISKTDNVKILYIE